MVSLLGVDDSEDTGDRLAEVVAVELHQSQISVCVPFISIDSPDSIRHPH